MKISTRKFAEKLQIMIEGQEEWLNSIYQYFPPPSNADRPNIKAKLDLRKMPGDFLEVKGELSYVPFVDCSKCGIKIQWPLNDQFVIYYQKDKPKSYEESQIDVSSQELDEYFLVDEEFDVAELLNDRIQLAIPYQTILTKPGCESECGVCGEDLEEVKVYGLKPEDDPTNPFAVLKNFKPKN